MTSKKSITLIPYYIIHDSLSTLTMSIQIKAKNITN